MGKSPPKTIDESLHELAALNAVEYEQRRTEAAKEMGFRLSALDEMVQARRKETSASSESILFRDPEPWPRPVDGAELLNSLTETVKRYIVLPHAAPEALALWVLHTYTHAAANVSPIVALLSATLRCGKTRALSLLQGLVWRPLPASNVTPAALFRSTELWEPTLLIDEADTFLKDSHELRGILNSGHTRDAAYVLRTVGEDHEPRRFKTWSPKAIAKIGDLPATLADRSIVIPMRRKRRDEKVKRLRLDKMSELGDLRRRCARWANDHIADLAAADPETPSQLHDRAQDNWRALLAIADAAGGDWPDRARKVATALTVDDEDNSSIGELLLSDFRDIFQKLELTEGDCPASTILARELHDMEHRPWPEWGRDKKPITPRQIAALLKPFAIKPKNIREGECIFKGYRCADFNDAFNRYLSPGLSATALQMIEIRDLDDISSATKR